MAYDLNPRLFLENGAAVQAAKARSTCSDVEVGVWKTLNRGRRLALIERALRADNDDCPDTYPIAL